MLVKTSQLFWISSAFLLSQTTQWCSVMPLRCAVCVVAIWRVCTWHNSEQKSLWLHPLSGKKNWQIIDDTCKTVNVQLECCITHKKKNAWKMGKELLCDRLCKSRRRRIVIVWENPTRCWSTLRQMGGLTQGWRLITNLLIHHKCRSLLVYKNKMGRYIWVWPIQAALTVCVTGRDTEKENEARGIMV